MKEGRNDIRRDREGEKKKEGLRGGGRERERNKEEERKIYIFVPYPGR